MMRAGGLAVIALIAEPAARRRFEVDGACLASWQVIAVGVEDAHAHPRQRSADGARTRSPVVRTDDGQPALSEAVVLDEDLAEPRRDLLFDRHRAGLATVE